MRLYCLFLRPLFADRLLCIPLVQCFWCFKDVTLHPCCAFESRWLINRIGGDRDNADTADKDAPQLVLQAYSTAFLRAEISVDLIPLVFPSH